MPDRPGPPQFEIDDVIDPADTRAVLTDVLARGTSDS